MFRARLSIWRIILRVGLVLTMPAIFACPAGALPQPAPVARISRVVLQFSHKRDLGSGAAISPQGNALAYVGRDGALYLCDLETGRRKVLVKQVQFSRWQDGADYLRNPSFSPDGAKLVFSASPGPTMYYPSDIFVVGRDGSGLTRLTRSHERPTAPPPGAPAAAVYAQYFRSPVYSPDGSRILLDAYNLAAAATGDPDNVALMAADGSGLKVVANGKPIAWSSDGSAVYLRLPNGNLGKYDVATQTTVAIAGLPHYDVIGKMAGKDWFAFDIWRKTVALYAIEGDVAYPRATLALPLTQSDPHGSLRLRSIEWTPSGRVLLTYRSDAIERLQVVLMSGM